MKLTLGAHAKECSMKENFESAIAQNPYDSSIRLVYADWLEEHGYDDEAMEQRRMSTSEWIEAHKWMTDFADRCGSEPLRWNHGSGITGPHKLTYEDVLQNGTDYVSVGGSDFFPAFETPEADLLMEDDGIVGRYWECWEILTNRKRLMWKANPFTCSC